MKKAKKKKVDRKPVKTETPKKKRQTENHQKQKNPGDL